MTAESPGMSDEAVLSATGRTWSEWEAWIDARDGRRLSHKEIVSLLREEGGVQRGWWQQAVTVGYEKLKGRRVTGETRESGFQVGLQRTIAVPSKRVWQLLTSSEGVRAWLGEVPDLEFEEGRAYRGADACEGEVRVVRPGERLRITWKPEGWDRASTIQIRLEPKGPGRSVVRFHEEHLSDASTRESRKAHFASAAARIVELTEA